MKTLGERVKLYRQNKLLSQRAMAKKSGLSQSCISDIERGLPYHSTTESKLNLIMNFKNVARKPISSNRSFNVAEWQTPIPSFRINSTHKSISDYKAAGEHPSLPDPMKASFDRDSDKCEQLAVEVLREKYINVSKHYEPTKPTLWQRFNDWVQLRDDKRQIKAIVGSMNRDQLESLYDFLDGGIACD